MSLINYNSIEIVVENCKYITFYIKQLDKNKYLKGNISFCGLGFQCISFIFTICLIVQTSQQTIFYKQSLKLLDFNQRVNF